MRPSSGTVNETKLRYKLQGLLVTLNVIDTDTNMCDHPNMKLLVNPKTYLSKKLHYPANIKLVLIYTHI